MSKLKGIVYLDGADATGKTTVCEALLRRYGGSRLHCTYRFKDRMFTYHTAVIREAIRRARHELVVLDRWWMSELIYAMVYRDGSPWPLIGRFLDRTLRSAAGLNVICDYGDLAAWDARWRRMKQRRSEFCDKVPWQVAKLYHDLYRSDKACDWMVVEASHHDYMVQLIENGGMWPRFDTLRYTIEDEGRDVDGFIRRVDTLLRYHRGRQVDLDGLEAGENFLGHALDSHYLLVGDVANPKGRGTIGWPFYEYGNCSQFLTQKLAEVNYQESWGCWTNINGPAGVGVVDRVLSHRAKYGSGTRVVVLGNAAEATFLKSFPGVKYKVVPHPQYGRRFHAHDSYYNDKLREALYAN